MTTSTGSYRLQPTAGVSIDLAERQLVGGSPQRMLTLSAQGAELVAGWFGGNPVGPGEGHRALAKRLVEAGLAIPSPEPSSADAAPLDVVIPVRDDAAGLTTTLAVLGEAANHGPDGGIIRRILILDDASEPAVDPAVGDDLDVPVTVMRRATSVGPGNARNLAVARGEAPTVVFVDAGVVVTGAQLRALAVELQVGATIAVAPRVRSEIGATRLARYERLWSPLDLGAEAGLVGPGRRLSYVPSTCLAVRRSAFLGAGGFDPRLRFGEDVDLVWRLGSAGWVRYIPGIEVTHPPRSTVGSFIGQRFRYGTSAGPLARRHGRTVAPARLDSRSAATWIALLAGFRRPATVIALTATTAYVAGLIRKGVAPRRAVRMVATGWVGTARGLALATGRAWWPLAVAAATRPRFRLVGWLLLAGWLRRLSPWRRRHDGPSEGGVDATGRVDDLAVDLALGVLDDSAYALGVWRGAVEARTAAPLLPDVPVGRRFRPYWAMNRSSS